MKRGQAQAKIIAIRQNVDRYDKSHRVHLRKVGATYKVDYYFEGRRIRQSLNMDDASIAETKRAELEFKLRAKQLQLPTDIRLDKFIDEYAKHLTARLAFKTAQTQIQYFRRFSADLPRLRLSQLNRGHIEAFIGKARGGKPSAKTWNNMRVYFYTMLKYAKNREYILENPVEKIERRREIQRSIRFLKQPDIEKLLGVLAGSRFHAMVATYIYAGLRRTEAIWLTWDDVDFDAKLIHIREKTIDGASWCPKTKKNRAVPISSRLLPYFQKQRKESDSIWVFPSPEGLRWDPDNLTHDFRDLMRRAGLPWNFLDLRHTFASQLAMHGVSLYKIARLMGNSSQICERHYAALFPEDLHKEVEF